MFVLKYIVGSSIMCLVPLKDHGHSIVSDGYPSKIRNHYIVSNGHFSTIQREAVKNVLAVPSPPYPLNGQ